MKIHDINWEALVSWHGITLHYFMIKQTRYNMFASEL